MAKKKHKQSDQARQKLIHAQHRNDFIKRLERMCMLICPQQRLFNMLTETERAVIYRCRGTGAKAVAVEGCKVSAEMLTEMQMVFNKVSAVQTIELTKDTGVFVTMQDYWNVVFALEIHAMKCTKGKEFYAEFLADKDRLRRYLDKALTIKMVMELYSMDFSKCMYNVTCSASAPEDLSGYYRHIELRVSSAEPEKRMITVDGLSRSAIRISWMSEGKIIPLSMPAGRLNKNSSFPKLLIPAYIQQHAIDRMDERIFVPWRGLMFLELIHAVVTGEIIRNSRGEMLVAYSISGNRVGYLLIDVMTGIVLVRTFLFLTNSGTPEGERLEQLTGLQKADREYLNIDNMDALVHSDILDNEEVCALFRKAGCQSLLDACRDLKESNMLDLLPERNIMSVSRISDYLKAAQYSMEELPDDAFDSIDMPEADNKPV